MRRRREALSEFNIWPAFTDALGGLVMVLIFLITVFVMTEVLIGREIMGKDTAIGQLQRIVEHLEGLAGAAEKEAARLRGRVQGLEGTVSERERVESGAIIFDEAPNHALGAQHLGRGQNQVSCGNPFGHFPGQFEANHFGDQH